MVLQIPQEASRALLAAHGGFRGCDRAVQVATRSTRACRAVTSICARRPLSSAVALPLTHARRRTQPIEAVAWRNGSALEAKRTRTRSYATAATATANNRAPPRNIAVLGGGITGLTTAWYLSRFCPDSQITLFEASGRLGGWIETETRHMKLPDGREGRVLFEHAARTIKTQRLQARYDDLVLYDLVTALKLKPKLLYTTKMDRMQRYIYFPDHLVDVTGPDKRSTFQFFTTVLRQIFDLFTEPLYKGAIASGVSFLSKIIDSDAEVAKKRLALVKAGAGGTKPKIEMKPAKDVSVGEYFTAKFGGRRDLVDNMLSALVHGVYGADVWKLSVMSSIFRGSFVRERNGSPGSGRIWLPIEDWDLVRELGQDEGVRRTAEQAQGADYLSFRGGLAALTEALEADLRANKNVDIKLRAPVINLKYNEGPKTVTVRRATGDDEDFDKVVSTVSAQQLCCATDKIPALKKQKSTSILLVNLWYPNTELEKGAQGFGYLVPSSVAAEHNSQAVLGVLFDSDREAAFAANLPGGSDGSDGDSTSPMDPDGLGGTKLTVMMGGHLWEDLPRELWPEGDEAVAMAKAAVAHQLGNPAFATEHAESSTKLCHNCIPQHRVGHCADMAAAHAQLTEAFGGKLAVAGGSYQLPGVLTSLRAARDIAGHVAGRLGHFGHDLDALTQMVRLQDPSYGHDGNMMNVPWAVGDTGLRRFLVESPDRAWWAQQPRTQMPFRFGNKVHWPTAEEIKANGGASSGGDVKS